MYSLSLWCGVCDGKGLEYWCRFDFIVSAAAANVAVDFAVIWNSLCQSNKREKLFANCSVSRTGLAHRPLPLLPSSLLLLLIKISVIKFHDILAVHKIYKEKRDGGGDSSSRNTRMFGIGGDGGHILDEKSNGKKHFKPHYIDIAFVRRGAIAHTHTHSLILPSFRFRTL